MRISNRVLTLSISAILALGVAAPLSTFAAGGPAKPAPSPKPDTQQRKVWTNDDVERLNPDFVAASGKQVNGGSSAASTIVVTPDLAKARSTMVASEAPLAPERDPAWYGQQMGILQSELSAVESRANELRNFRNTAAGLQTGLTLNAPCTGITTDNLIANLEAQRQEILAQIDGLGDLARTNGLPPGILVEGRGLVQTSVQPTVEEQRTALTSLTQAATEQLAEVHGTVASMHYQASSLHANLQQPTPGFGGNPTTDLLTRLDSRATLLESVINSANDAARSLGVPPIELR